MSFGGYLDDPLPRELDAFWRQKRVLRRMPLRSRIDPAEMPRLLRHLVIGESIEDGSRFPDRLAGTAVAGGLGLDPTGAASRTSPAA